MTKHADIELKTLFCTNSCALLKSAKKWWAQCENDKTVLIAAENAVLYKLMHFAENVNNWSAQSENDKTS